MGADTLEAHTGLQAALDSFTLIFILCTRVDLFGGDILRIEGYLSDTPATGHVVTPVTSLEHIISTCLLYDRHILTLHVRVKQSIQGFSDLLDDQKFEILLRERNHFKHGANFLRQLLRLDGLN